MKNLLFLALFIPCFAKAQYTIVNTSTTNLLELRSGTWPLNLERSIKKSDTSYVLEFRDQQYTSEVNMSSLHFRGLRQLKELQRALIDLKNGSNGDEAKFKDFSVKRTDVKKDGVWYILTVNDDGSITNFQQPEADKMIATIKGL